jgi:hypothetical protein
MSSLSAIPSISLSGSTSTGTPVWPLTSFTSVRSPCDRGTSIDS